MTRRKLAKLRITLKRSPIGYESRQRGTARSLGLRRLRQSSVHEDSPVVRGMIRRIAHLVEVEHVE